MEIVKEQCFAEERHAEIIKLLQKKKKVLVLELCEKFGVSPATIRNDLNSLEDQGLLERTHGGAIARQRTSYEENVAEKLSKNRPQKEAIADVAATLVENGDVIAVDTGTTTLSFVKKLTNKKKLTIITNDLTIAAFADQHLEESTVIMLGGIIRNKHDCTLGAMTLNNIKAIHVDKCFVAVNGLTADFGLSTPDMNHSEVKKALMAAAERTIVLCDSSKIGCDVFVRITPVTEADCIVTDEDADKEELEKIEQAGVEIMIAQVNK